MSKNKIDWDYNEQYGFRVDKRIYALSRMLVGLPKKESIRVLLYKDGDTWIAVCLEYGLVTQGERLKETMISFAK